LRSLKGKFALRHCPRGKFAVVGLDLVMLSARMLAMVVAEGKVKIKPEPGPYGDRRVNTLRLLLYRRWFLTSELQLDFVSIRRVWPLELR
jgi:hypothetical protein